MSPIGADSRQNAKFLSRDPSWCARLPFAANRHRLRLAERDSNKTKHQQRGEPERDAAEHIHRCDGLADGRRLGRVAKPGNIRYHAGNRGPERGADRAHRGQGSGGASLFVGRCALLSGKRLLWSDELFTWYPATASFGSMLRSTADDGGHCYRYFVG